MPIDYTAKWQALDGSAAFLFSDPYGIEFWEGDKLSYRIPSADTPGDGEYAGDGSAEARNVTMGGLLTGDTPEEFLARMDALTAALRGGVFGKLYKSADRFLYCRAFSFGRERDDGIENTRWEATFRASDPFYYDEVVSSQALAVSGATAAFAIGGTYPAIPTTVLTVSAAPANSSLVVAVTSAGVTTTFTLRPSATGVYTIDHAAGTVLLAAADKIADFSGAFLDLGIGPGDAAITITPAGGATLSSASLQWRKRYVAA